jgi:hypothetical protein
MRETYDKRAIDSKGSGVELIGSDTYLAVMMDLGEVWELGNVWICCELK